MIALILGTSEGKKIVSLLNEFTDDLLITTATSYGGELLKDFKYKVLNSKPLSPEELEKMLLENQVAQLVDASHPYAVEITKNAREICKRLNIEYIRYERPSVIGKFREYEKLVEVRDYKELEGRLKEKEELNNESAVLLDTCGSKNIEKMFFMGLKSRIVHRVLPSVEVMGKCLGLGIRVDDVIAIKGPVGYELNKAFIKQYDAKAVILKDSGAQGGTEEKVKAAMDCGIHIFVLGRKENEETGAFSSEEEVVDHIRQKLLQRQG